MTYEDKSKLFDFERSFCLDNLKVWRNEAQNLFYSAEVLYKFESLKRNNLFQGNNSLSSLFPSDLTNCLVFNYRVQRMLWAYAFENLLKLLIIANLKNSNADLENRPFNEIKSHNLKGLAEKAQVKLSELESSYLEILEKCSIWAGRYPLPLKSKQMYNSREALPSEDALIERERQNLKKWRKGEISRIESESDILYSAIGWEEYSTYQRFKNKLLMLVEEYL